MRRIQVTGQAMAPTLLPGDTAVSLRFGGDPRPGELILFTPPVPAGGPMIGRVLAQPGDTFDVYGGIAYRNGAPLQAAGPARIPYAFAIHDYALYLDGTPLSPTLANVPERAAWRSPERVPDGCYLVFGDRPGASVDSHDYGCAQAGGTFATGPRRGAPARIDGRIVMRLRGGLPSLLR